PSPPARKEPDMGRKETVSYHQQEAAAARQLAAQADGPGRGDLLEQAQEHDAMAEAARVGDYPTDLPRSPAARGARPRSALQRALPQHHPPHPPRPPPHVRL